MPQTRLYGARRATRSLLLATLTAAIPACDDRPAPAVSADGAADTTTTSPAAQLPPAAADTPPPARAPSPDTAAGAEWTVRDTRVTIPAKGAATLLAVRTAPHPDFDRTVFEFAGADLPSYRLSYVDRPVRQCGSGDVVPLAGDAWLSMQFEPANAHTEQGAPTVTERNRSPRLPNLLELKLICDFEAVVEWVAGVRSPRPYRVMALRQPSRIVVDVQH
jgi:hypothetical protein